MSTAVNYPVEPFVTGPEHERLHRLVGSYEGTARTWLDPEGAPEEDAWSGAIAPLLDGRFVRFTYGASLQGAAIAGELTLGFDRTRDRYVAVWMDSFHTDTASMQFVGEGGDGAIKVLGHYHLPGHEPWGWRIEVADATADRLTIRMYNLSPEGQEEQAVEIALARR